MLFCTIRTVEAGCVGKSAFQRLLPEQLSEVEVGQINYVVLGVYGYWYQVSGEGQLVRTSSFSSHVNGHMNDSPGNV